MLGEFPYCNCDGSFVLLRNFSDYPELFSAVDSFNSAAARHRDVSLLDE